MKFTILKRLILGYLTIMIMVIFMGLYVNIKLNQLNRITHDLLLMDLRTFREIENMSNILLSQIKYEKKYMLLKDPDFYEQFNKAKQDFETSMVKIKQLLALPGEASLVTILNKSYSRYLLSFKNEVLLIKNDENYSHGEYEEKRSKITDEIDHVLKEIILIERKERVRKIELSGRISSRVLRVSSATAWLTILTGVLISFISTRSINRSLKLLKSKTRDLATGKFVEINDIVSPPEMKELADDFNIMSKRLKELDEMKMDFISDVSHELRTPLTAIREASGMLLDKRMVKSPEEQNQLLIITKEECERLIESVSKILDLSRMESGMMEYQIEKSSIITLLQKTVLKLAPIAHSKGIELVINPVPRLPDVVMDRDKIGNVVENLVGNALKYTQENGKVTITISHVKDEEEFILVSVTDNGPGITNEEHYRIFEKFIRSDTQDSAVKGSGLGLSIAKHIITDHGGKIWVESKPGVGSIFSFTLSVS